MAGQTRPTGGFSFLELVVVLSLLAIITAAIVPLYGSSVTSMRQRNVRSDLVATIYYLQELSVRQSRELRLIIDDDERRYWAEGWASGLGDDAVYEPLTDPVVDETKILPENVIIARVQAAKDRKRDVYYITFYPNGACDPATIRFGERRGGRSTFSIETTGALGDVVVTP